jgi:hypothetical protein
MPKFAADTDATAKRNSCRFKIRLRDNEDVPDL